MTARFLRPRGVAAMAAAVVVALAAGAAGAAEAADRTRYDLFREVQERVLRYAFFTVFDDVAIAIDDDFTVTLTGSVTGEHKKRDIERRVADLPSVTAVHNQITVLPVSRQDDRLRYLVARAIYANPHFQRYGVGAQPPIRVIVNRGHVTLTGVVATETDRRLARSLAGQFEAFSVTNALRLPSEVTRELEALG